MKKIIIFSLTVIFCFSCEKNYWGDSAYYYMSENGWKNENITIETSWKIINDTTKQSVQYFKWYRNDTFYLEGYIDEFIKKYQTHDETYALVVLTNGYYTQFKQVGIEKEPYNEIVLDTKWPRKSIDSLSLFDYERLEAY